MKKLKCIIQYPLIKITLAAVAAAAVLLAATPAQASTGWIHGGNWAHDTDVLNYEAILYPDGITAGMTTAQATAVAKTVAFDYKSIGINFVRYPINPATVQTNWAVTQAAINELIAEGLRVDICCFYIDWRSGGTGQIVNMSAWKSMWQTIDGIYGGNSYVYYEPINEPFGYTLSSLESVYQTFLGLGLTKTQGYMFLDGTGYASSVTGIGGDSSFNNCLLAVHDYAMWNTSLTTESQWETDIQNRVGSYYGRTVMTEMGAETDNGLNYGQSSTTDYNISFIRGMCNQCRSWPMGFMYFPAHQVASVGNNKRLFKDPGAGVFNPSMVIELQYGWNLNLSWHAWDTVTSATGFINGFAACSWGPLREDVFGVKADGKIYHAFLVDTSAGSTWSSWSTLTPPVTPAGAPGASANNGVPGREDLYCIGTDGNLYHAYYSGSWSSWQNIGAPYGVTLVGSPSATSWAAGRYDVYCRGSSPRHIYHVYSNDGSTWYWQDNGGSVTNDVAACSWGANRLDGFALGTGTGQIWHQYWGVGGWHPNQTNWMQDLPETSGCKYALGAACWATNRIDLFNNTGSTIGHIRCPAGGGWSGDWTETHTPPSTPVSAPCATSWGVNRVDVFVLGADSKCHHLYWGL